MTKVYNRFGVVYWLIKKKHPDWSDKQLRACTAYALRKR